MRGLLGELADEMLLSSARVLPGRLTRAGFPFLFPELESALAFELGRSSAPPGLEIEHD
jgi:NAD dependent epimerase/dehydratase family enzyme